MNDIRILFVGHHETILNQVELLLQEERFQKTFVNNARDALQILSIFLQNCYFYNTLS